MIIKVLELQETQPVITPGVKNSDKTTEPGDDMPLSASQSTLYRATVARANYLSADRLDIAYAVKELSRAMSTPTESDMRSLKRLGRYLLGRPRMVLKYNYQQLYNTITVWTDSDYAGCAKTRRSTTGGLLTLGEHSIKHWSYTQAVLATSSGEAEYYSLVKGGSVSPGVKALLTELGIGNIALQLKTDASVAKGIAQRRGLGKIVAWKLPNSGS